MVLVVTTLLFGMVRLVTKLLHFLKKHKQTCKWIVWIIENIVKLITKIIEISNGLTMKSIVLVWLLVKFNFGKAKTLENVRITLKKKKRGGLVIDYLI